MRARVGLEWAILAASALVIVLVGGFLAIDGLTGGDDPPDPVVTVQLDQGRAGAHGWIVPATVLNRGHEAAEAVVLEATATVAGATETSEIDVDFLPSGTVVEVAFAFSGQPEAGVEIRLVGFRLP
jgi:uncharacterized protein (TIGR02588 family)